MLSPYFYNVYVDDLSSSLNNISAGCSVGNVSINHLLYADDVCLLASSVPGLRALISCCTDYADDHDLLFNPRKTKAMYFLPRNFVHGRCANVYNNDVLVRCVRSCLYLGHILSCDI